MSLSLDLALDWLLAEEVNPAELILSGDAQRRFSLPPDREDRVQYWLVELAIESGTSVQFAKRRTALPTAEGCFAGAWDVPLRNFPIRFSRRNDAQLNLQNADLGESKSGDRLALNQVDAFVQLLMQNSEARAERRAAAEFILGLTQ